MGLLIDFAGRWRHHFNGTISPCLVAGLTNGGVQIELCGGTAQAHNYGNEDLLPGIKVNTDAMARTIELVRRGFVKISES